MQTTSETPAKPDLDIVVLRGAPLPTERPRPQRPAPQTPGPSFDWPQPRARRRFGGLLGISAVIVIGLPTLLGSLYFGLIAADQYVTEFKFTVRGAQQAPAPKDAMSTLTGMPGGSGGLETMQDATIITDFITSRQGYQDVQSNIDARKLFADPRADFIARLNPEIPIERMERYWTKMVDARLDQLTGIVTVDVRAFGPEESLALANGVIKSADNMVNTLNAQAENDLVKQSAQDLDQAEDRWRSTQAELLKYQQEFQVIDPSKAVDAVAAISADLFGQLNQLKTQYTAMSAYLAPNSAQIQMLRDQIKALEAQIPKVGESAPDTRALARNAAPEALAKFQSIQLHASFAGQALTQALNALVRAHELAAERQIYLAIFVKPTLAESSLYPNRLSSVFIIFLAAGAAWCLSVFVLYTVRDHLA